MLGESRQSKTFLGPLTGHGLVVHVDQREYLRELLSAEHQGIVQNRPNRCALVAQRM